MSLHDSMAQDPNADDEDFDSRMVPQASAFFELYAPWIAPGNQILPAEFDPDRDGGVDLAQLTSDSSDPVWRILAVRRADFAMADTPGQNLTDVSFNPFMDPDGATNGPGSTSQVFNDNSIKRYIYFNRPGRTGDPQFDGPLVYHTDFNGNIDDEQPVVLQPGNFAVVGSAGQLIGDNYTTLLGRRSDHIAGTPVDIENTRRIEMEVTGTAPDDNGQGVVRVYNAENITEASESLAGTLVLPMISHNDPARSLGLTDPDGGYGGNVAENTAEGEGRIFTDPTDPSNMNFALDTPADRSMQMDPLLYNNLLGVDQLNRRPFLILLQRLADPTRDLSLIHI